VPDRKLHLGSNARKAQVIKIMHDVFVRISLLSWRRKRHFQASLAVERKTLADCKHTRSLRQRDIDFGCTAQTLFVARGRHKSREVEKAAKMPGAAALVIVSRDAIFNLRLASNFHQRLHAPFFEQPHHL
jgi:hypothetical protein